MSNLIINIKVKLLTGITHVFEVKYNSTIKILKDQIIKDYKGTSDILINYMGIVLDDSKTFEYYHIQEQETLYFALNMGDIDLSESKVNDNVNDKVNDNVSASISNMQQEINNFKERINNLQNSFESDIDMLDEKLDKILDKLRTIIFYVE